MNKIILILSVYAITTFPVSAALLSKEPVPITIDVSESSGQNLLKAKNINLGGSDDIKNKGVLIDSLQQAGDSLNGKGLHKDTISPVAGNSTSNAIRVDIHPIPSSIRLFGSVLLALIAWKVVKKMPYSSKKDKVLS